MKYLQKCLVSNRNVETSEILTSPYPVQFPLSYVVSLSKKALSSQEAFCGLKGRG